jgi:probable phosphoglycerate mutase
MKQDFYFFRHGQTNYNIEKRSQGWVDTPLNDKGIAQAHELAQKLSNIKFDCIYSSPLSRALKTAEIVRGDKDIKIITDDGLKERNMGIIGGKLINLTNAPADTPITVNADTIEIPSTLFANEDFVPENGESYNMYAKRVMDTLLKIAHNTKAKTVGIAVHSGVIRVLLRAIMHKKFPPGSVPNATYIKMQWDGENFTLAETPDWLLK